MVSIAGEDLAPLLHELLDDHREVATRHGVEPRHDRLIPGLGGKSGQTRGVFGEQPAVLVIGKEKPHLLVGRELLPRTHEHVGDVLEPVRVRVRPPEGLGREPPRSRRKDCQGTKSHMNGHPLVSASAAAALTTFAAPEHISRSTRASLMSSAAARAETLPADPWSAVRNLRARSLWSPQVMPSGHRLRGIFHPPSVCLAEQGEPAGLRSQHADAERATHLGHRAHRGRRRPGRGRRRGGLPGGDGGGGVGRHLRPRHRRPACRPALPRQATAHAPATSARKRRRVTGSSIMSLRLRRFPGLGPRGQKWRVTSGASQRFVASSGAILLHSRPRNRSRAIAHVLANQHK